MSWGLAPASLFYMTQQAANTLESVDAICGYKVYLDLIRDEFPCEEYYSTGMTQEIDRCRWALEKASTGKRVALVCSGDAGVYGMASPLLELAPGYPDVAVEIVPGLTAALSGGAVLGAPLAHDFCVISLSDRLTPWEVIEKRLACAAIGDFCVALYNPSSKGRPDYLAKAVRILLENGKSADTVCGLVRNIGRDGQTARVLSLAQLESTAVDMFTTVYIGNATTKQLGGRMVTHGGTADEGSGFQRHYRGTGVLPAAGGTGRTGAGQRSHPAGCGGAGRSGRHHCALRAADPRGNDRPFCRALPCVDATHPYAVDATKNIRAACAVAGVEYHRLLREESPLPAGSMVFATAAHAAAFLAGCSGNVLLTTGAKRACRLCAAQPGAAVPPGAAHAGGHCRLRDRRCPTQEHHCHAGAFQLCAELRLDEAILHPVSSHERRRCCGRLCRKGTGRTGHRRTADRGASSG